MISVFSLIRRRDGIDTAGFNRHWLDPHGVLVCRFPHLRRYSQNRVIAALSPAGSTLRLDGIAELSYDSTQDQEAATHSPAMAACDVDSPQFIGAVVRIVAEAEIVVPPPPCQSSTSKLMLLMPPGVAAPACPAGVVGRIENEVRQQLGPASDMPVLDFPVGNISELWFPELDALERAAAALASACHEGVAMLAIDEVRLI